MYSLFKPAIFQWEYPLRLTKHQLRMLFEGTAIVGPPLFKKRLICEAISACLT
jgi:hypothetical protein